ncbi:MAG: DUF4097 family beta strand repeat-containing protein [Gammaproteobacteria bacterium]
MNTKTFMLLIAAMLPLAAHADRDVDRTLPSSGVKEVRISNTSGSVEVTGADGDEIRVTGRIEEDVEELVIEKDGTVLAIEVKIDASRHGRTRASAELRVGMPADLALTVIGTSADIEVDGIRGEQRLKSVSGDVRTEIWSQPLDAETVSGDLRVKGHGETSRLRLAAVSGDVDAEAVAGELEAKSVSGDLVIEADGLDRGRFESTSGDVIAEIALERGGRIEAESVSGDVELTLGGDVDAEIDVSSFSGRIDNCFGPKPERKSRYAPGSELRFTHGEGRGDIRVKTLSGDVELCNR